jgi:isopentenyl-diphosphate delta-isomerase type 1
MSDEMFELVDEMGRVIGLAPRKRCHGDPSLIHQSVHVFVFDRQGRLFLQKRSLSKDIQPGKWDTSVGGHMQPGEKPEDAARREMTEELGVTPATLTFQYQYLWRSSVETELVRSFIVLHEGPFNLDPVEIDEGRFWPLDEIRAQLGKSVFTTNFEYEFGMDRLRLTEDGKRKME